jgi:hypothetical protein
MTETKEDIVYANGLDGETGKYLVEPMTYGQVVDFVKGRSPKAPLLQRVEAIWRRFKDGKLDLPNGRRYERVDEAGWAVVFHPDEDPLVKKALRRLKEHRMSLIKDEQVVKELVYDGQQGVDDWLVGHGVEDEVIPWRVPYYLLLVGDPERISFDRGLALSLEYAVGHLHFDNPDHYAQYVDSLIQYENGEAPARGKAVTFFGTRHMGDKATHISADDLIVPLADGVPATEEGPALAGVAASQGFCTHKILGRPDDGQAAVRDALAQVLSPSAGTVPPALLFSATHGVGFPKGHPLQFARQGALVCQDWTGSGDFKPDHYFSAENLEEKAVVSVHGLIAFLFACYSAGTPAHDAFRHKPGEAPPEIAEKPFVAALPKALLSHPKGGALACIGHVERAWSYSITSNEVRSHVQPFRTALTGILTGEPVGHAMRDFRRRYSKLGNELKDLLLPLYWGATVSDTKVLANLWMRHSDARNYVVIGDPAAKLRVEDLS